MPQQGNILIESAPAQVTVSPLGHLLLAGSWEFATLKSKSIVLPNATPDAESVIVIDATKLDFIDGTGAWILQNCLQRLRQQGKQIRLEGWTASNLKLMQQIEQQQSVKLPTKAAIPLLNQIGMNAAAQYKSGFALLSFIGQVAMALVANLSHRSRWRWAIVCNNVQSAGVDALAIIGITSCLLGVVVAYQGVDQLRHYGANIFVVDLIGYSMLREFSPLITAIIIAGRSSSAFAAQIGTMKIMEELDGMRTIGIDPINMLVLPKLIALMLVLPLLTVFSDMAGVVGGMVMARSQLDISFNEFLTRFALVIHPTSFLIGVGKALVFSVVITLIGCFQGLATKGDADSVGQQTTRSVVQSIFIVISLDAVFSVVFSLLGM
ncbi:ABC transporter permease [Sapientia aquatica]|uniref:ABC transporter permease n=1 Tax=Sapientia aquatica TaxID=1549640 RepID=UPI001981E8D2|nr:ABC transporter permease [Sapientia aquatica]